MSRPLTGLVGLPTPAVRWIGVAQISVLQTSKTQSACSSSFFVHKRPACRHPVQLPNPDQKASKRILIRRSTSFSSIPRLNRCDAKRGSASQSSATPRQKPISPIPSNPSSTRSINQSQSIQHSQLCPRPGGRRNEPVGTQSTGSLQLGQVSHIGTEVKKKGHQASTYLDLS